MRTTMPGWAALVLVCWAVSTALGQVAHEETRLGPLPETWLGQPTVSDDGWNMAGVDNREGKVRVWFNGVEGPQFDDIAKDHPVLSATGGRIAYDACLGDWQGGQHLAVIDGTPSVAFDALFGPHFLAGDKRVWAIGWRGAKVVPLVDGIAGAEWDEIGDPVSPPDGAHFAYAASAGGRWTVVVDGVPGQAWDEVSGLFFHDTIQGYTYAGRRGEDWFLWTRGAESGPFEEIAAYTVDLDGQGRLSFRAKTGGQWRVYLDGRTGPALDEIGGHIPAKTPGGQDVTTGKLGDKWAVFVGDTPGPGYDEIFSMTPRLTDQGKLTYAARNGEQWWLVADGATFGPYQEVHYSSPTISANGRIAYIVRKDDKWHVWLEGSESPAYDEFEYLEKSFALCFSQDGAHVAWAAKRNGKSVVVLDGVEGPEFDDVAVYLPLFLPGSSAPTYVGRTGPKDRLVLRGELLPEYDQVAVETDWPEEGRQEMVAAVFTNGEKQSVWVSGQQGPWYDEVGDVGRSDASGRVSYAAKKGGKWVAVVDGAEWPECDALIQSPSFDPTGRRAVCIGRYGEEAAIILDGAAQPTYSSIRGPYSYPVAEGFSQDGKRFAYIAENPNETRMVVDGVPGPVFTWIPGDGPPRYHPDGTLEYLGVRDNVLCRVRVAPAQ